jgi:hypothetical protein
MLDVGNFAKHASGGDVAGGSKGGSMFGSMLDVGNFAKHASGGDVAGGSKGGGIFSGILGAIGLGMPEKVKRKHFNRMIALDKELHSKGKLSPVQHNKLKVYHTLHGAGFFDSLWSGLKKGASAVASVVPQAITAIPQVLKVVPEVAKFVPGVGKLIAPLAKVAPLAALL